MAVLKQVKKGVLFHLLLIVKVTFNIYRASHKTICKCCPVDISSSLLHQVTFHLMCHEFNTIDVYMFIFIAPIPLLPTPTIFLFQPLLFVYVVMNYSGIFLPFLLSFSAVALSAFKRL